MAEYDLAFQQRDDEGTVLPGPHFRDYLTLIARQARLSPELLQYALPYCDHLARLDVTDLENQVKFWQGEGMADKGIAGEMPEQRIGAPEDRNALVKFLEKATK